MKNKGLCQLPQKGFSVIGAVVGIIVGLIIVIAFTTLISGAIRYSSINEKQLKAELYLQELVEVAKDLEQSDWGLLNSFTCTSPEFFYPYPTTTISGTLWDLTNGKETLEGGIYTRWLIIQRVCRDTSNNEISTSSCDTTECDPGGSAYSSTTKKVIAEIEWMESPGKTATATLEAYLYNYNP